MLSEKPDLQYAGVYGCDTKTSVMLKDLYGCKGAQVMSFIQAVEVDICIP